MEVIDNRVKCRNCLALIGVKRLVRRMLATYPGINQTICPVCDYVIESDQDRIDRSYDIVFLDPADGVYDPVDAGSHDIVLDNGKIYGENDDVPSRQLKQPK